MISWERTTAGLEDFLSKHWDVILEKLCFTPTVLLQAGDQVMGSVSLQPLFKAEQRDADGKKLAVLPI